MSGSRERWLAAVGLALTPGCPAATAPARLAWLAAEGAGLAALASSVSFAPRRLPLHSAAPATALC